MYAPVCTTDGWCQMLSDAPVGSSLQSFLTNVTTTLGGTAFAQYKSYLVISDMQACSDRHNTIDA